MARSQHLGAGAVEPGRAYSADHGDSERMGGGHEMVVVEFVVVEDVWFESVLVLIRMRSETRFSTGKQCFHGDQEVG